MTTAITRAAKPTRKERERLRHREEILHAAERVFGKKGFHPATMNDIATEAEFGIGTIYNFFESKEEIFYQFFEHKLDEMISSVLAAIEAAPDNKSKIEALVTAYLDHFQRNKETLKLFMAEMPFFDWTIEKKLGANLINSYARFMAELGKTMESGIAAGDFARGDSMQMAISLLGIINTTIHYLSIIGNFEEMNILDHREQILSIFFNGILKKAPDRKRPSRKEK